MDIVHDGGEALFGLFECPAVPRGVLLHFQCRRGNAAGIGSLAGRKDAGFLEQANRLRCRRHVGAFAEGDDAVLQQGLRVLAGQFVLCCRRHCHVAGHVPDRAALDIMASVALQLRILGNALAADFLDLLDEIEVDAILVDDIAV